MTENMITVALIIGDPGHDDLQLNEGCLTAAAKTIEVHGAATHGRRDAGRRSTVRCFDIERPAPRISRTICKPSGPASLSPSSGGPSGRPRSFASAERSPSPAGRHPQAQRHPRHLRS